MKKWMLLLTVGVVGMAAILRNINQRKEVLNSVSERAEDKNFGAFPPDIPEEQFEALFI